MFLGSEGISHKPFAVSLQILVPLVLTVPTCSELTYLTMDLCTCFCLTMSTRTLSEAAFWSPQSLPMVHNTL